ncbi:hypothetical protein [Intrasporangium flavum]|uniref:hypothetical protein n=1 Tax=Intrasporangium flavum TaxID=1428657 RepID=UPI00096EB375|nr:hypothetical protein [Intrasporangium flavum]
MHPENRLTADVADALRRLDALPPGARRREAADALLDRVRGRDVHDELWVRMHVIDAGHGLPQRVADLEHVTWMLDRVEAAEADDAERLAVLWRAKCALDTMLATPACGLDAVEQLADRAERLATAAGLSTRSIALVRARCAGERGDAAAADLLLAAAAALPVDALADCPTCEAREVALVRVRSDRGRGVADLRRAVDAPRACHQEPRMSFGLLHALAARGGDEALARWASRRGRPAVLAWFDRGEDAPAAAAGHVVGLALRGRRRAAGRRALVLAGHPTFSGHDLEAYLLSSAVACALHRAPGSPGARPLPEAVEDLRRTAAARAHALAEAFDARSGTRHRRDELAELLAPPA